MFPEADLGEITEARVREWRKQRVGEIHLAEHRVVGDGGLGGRDIRRAEELAESAGDLRVVHHEQDVAAVSEKLTNFAVSFFGQSAGDYYEPMGGTRAS